MGLSRQSATSAATTRSSTSSDWHVCRAAGELTRDVGGIQKDTFRVCEKSATMVSRWPDGQTGSKDEETLFENRRHCVWHCRVGGRAGSRAATARRVRRRGEARAERRLASDGAQRGACGAAWLPVERVRFGAGRGLPQGAPRARDRLRDDGAAGAAGDSAAGEDDLPVAVCVDFIDPFVGTAFTGHTHPAACVPFGLVQAGPDMGNFGWAYCSGYRDEDRVIVGFSQTHLNGTGGMDLGDAMIMPVAGAARNLSAEVPGWDFAAVRAAAAAQIVRCRGSTRIGGRSFCTGVVVGWRAMCRRDPSEGAGSAGPHDPSGCRGWRHPS